MPVASLDEWQVNITQDVKGKAVPAFGLAEGIYTDYDLIYVYNDMLFNGSKNVDGRLLINRKTGQQICKFLW
ncbi:MAG: hypothetical protein WDM90_25085 [Ferruginibacter sp.]